MTRPLPSVALAAVITLIAWMTAAIPIAHTAPGQAQDYAVRVAHVLQVTPLIDGQNDWAEVLRERQHQGRGLRQRDRHFAMTAFDFIVIGIIGLSTVFAFARGFVRVVISLAAWVVALVAAFQYADTLAAWLPALGGASRARYIAAFVVIGFFIPIVHQSANQFRAHSAKADHS